MISSNLWTCYFYKNVLAESGEDSVDCTSRRAPDTGSESTPTVANGTEDEETLSPRAAFKIGGVTFYPRENGKKHRTSKFQLAERGTPILRRGQNFYIALMYAPGQSRKFDPNTDQLKLIFSFGPHPSPINGTQQIFKVEKVLHSDESRWSARIKGHDEHAMTIEVCA